MRVILSLALALATLSACGNEQPAGEPDVADGTSDATGDGATSDPGPGTGTDSGDTGDTDNDTTGDDTDDNETETGEDTGEEPEGSGFEYPCTPGTTRACVTACGSAGQQLCLKEWGPCIPPEEWCGSCADDDCDGLINEGCPPDPTCDPEEPDCPTAVISIDPPGPVGIGTTLSLSAAGSTSPNGAVTVWAWSANAPVGSTASFVPGDDVEAPTFTVDLAGGYLFTLVAWDETGVESCVPAQAAVSVGPVPPLDPEVGCADGEREGFLDLDAWTHIAACAGAWDQPGITPAALAQTCGGAGGDDGAKPEGEGCSAPDLCAEGWHVCDGWQDVAASSPTGCAGATPPDAKSKSLFFALRQHSEDKSVCGEPGDGFNDVFGCGNLGTGLGPDKGCGPLDRVIASTQPDQCGFNEAEPPLGPWECSGDEPSHLNEGKLVTKKGCPGASCSTDGAPIGSSDKGGVLCCR